VPKRRRRGEGTIFFDSRKGLWVGAVRVQAPDGARSRPTFYEETRAEVVERLAETKRAIQLGLQPQDRRLTVGKHLHDWLESKRDSVRVSTFVSYEGHVRIQLASIHMIALTRLTPGHVRHLSSRLLDEGLAPRTVAYSLTVLRMALDQALGDGLLARNVASASLVKRPKVERRALMIWQPGVVRRFLDETETEPLGPLWSLLVGSGMRLGECLGLRWSDVDLDAGVLSVTGSLRPIDRRHRAIGSHRLVRVEPKSDSAYRHIALPVFVQTALRSLLTPAITPLQRFVFSTPRGTPLDARNVSRQFEKAIVRTGVPRVRIHDLRHTATSLMLAQGMTLDDVKRVLGHASIVLTSDTYGHLVEGRSRQIADSMDRALGGRY
jgi:integrase